MEQQSVPVNAGTLSRVFRIALGVVMLASVFVGPRTPLGWMGILPLLTGILGRCPTMSCSTGACATRPPERPE